MTLVKSELPWDRLTFGVYNREQIATAVHDECWQMVRETLKGEPMIIKFGILGAYLRVNNGSEEAKIRVTNYVNALRRAGLVKAKCSKH